MAMGGMGGIGEWAGAIDTAINWFIDEKEEKEGNNYGTSKGTQVIEEEVSQEKATALLKQLLEGVNGLAAVSSGQNIAGGYDSTTQQMLTNDLLSRSTAQVAALGSKKTVQQEQTTHNKQVDTFEKDAPIERDWIICTELYKQGRIDKKHFVVGYRVFAGYDEQTKRGYHFWARSWVAHLKAHPTSRRSKLMEVIFSLRAEHMAAIAGVAGARKTKRGAVIEAIGRPACKAIGFFISRNYSAEQLHIGA